MVIIMNKKNEKWINIDMEIGTEFIYKRAFDRKKKGTDEIIGTFVVFYGDRSDKPHYAYLKGGVTEAIKKDFVMGNSIIFDGLLGKETDGKWENIWAKNITKKDD